MRPSVEWWYVMSVKPAPPVTDAAASTHSLESNSSDTSTAMAPSLVRAGAGAGAGLGAILMRFGATRPAGTGGRLVA
ncbi:hypothetical protein GCM10025870_14750 [Agromyces marinus]|uniref:Uncharacterized protein n=1 Tax=Agromyces marinus TaxID=1389020 RepID=A0ABM8H0V2_9MICO|nr:hypothetical protein GCM10025870_14750 [Agromyces marinus]